MSSVRKPDLCLPDRICFGPRARLGAQKLRMRLGGSPSLSDAFPDKPRTMHWKTYRKMKQRHDRLAGVAFAQLSAKLEKSFQ